MTPRQVGRWAGATGPELRERWGREHVYVYGEVGSTHEIARELAEEGAPSGTIVLARKQAEGRGRSGRDWYSPDGGVYLSMVFHPPAEVPPLVTILAGLSVALELARAFPGIQPQVKWPNDLMLDDRKLAGILAETSRGGGGRRRLLVGVGLNVQAQSWPKRLRGRAISLEEADAGDDRLAAADAVVAGLERWLPDPPAVLDEARLEELDRLDWLKGRRVALDGAEGDSIPGRAVGIAPDGALLFRPDRGALRRVSSGSVEPLAEGPSDERPSA